MHAKPAAKKNIANITLLRYFRHNILTIEWLYLTPNNASCKTVYW